MPTLEQRLVNAHKFGRAMAQRDIADGSQDEFKAFHKGYSDAWAADCEAVARVLSCKAHDGHEGAL